MPKAYEVVAFTPGDTVSMNDNDDPVGEAQVLIELDDFDSELLNGAV